MGGHTNTNCLLLTGEMCTKESWSFSAQIQYNSSVTLKSQYSQTQLDMLNACKHENRKWSNDTRREFNSAHSDLASLSHEKSFAQTHDITHHLTWRYPCPVRRDNSCCNCVFQLTLTTCCWILVVQRWQHSNSCLAQGQARSLRPHWWKERGTQRPCKGFA